MNRPIRRLALRPGFRKIVWTFLVAVVLATAVIARAQQAPVRTPPKPLAGNPLPEYSDALIAKAGEGVVTFRADVDASGAVTNFSALETTVGKALVDAAESAVRRWRFAPATADGQPVAGIYAGQLEFQLAGDVANGRTYRASSAEAWNQVQRVLADAKMKIAERDAHNQHVVTDWIAPDTRLAPDATAIGLPAGWKLRRYKLMIYVSPFVEPARVYVGSLAEAELDTVGAVVKRESLKPTAYAFYNVNTLQDWAFTHIDASLGDGAPIPLSRVRRNRDSKGIATDRTACSVDAAIAELKPLRGRPQSEFARVVVAPSKFYAPELLYPADAARER